MSSLLDAWRARRAAGPWIMGVLNCTPDSFSDGGRHAGEAAIRHGLRLWEEGAAIVDVGGESTRPGAAPVSLEEELRRVMPVIEGLCAEGVAVSVDTCKPEVMRRAVAAGAVMINDVRALREPGALAVAAEAGVDVCLMHMRGTPETMQQDVEYADAADEVTRWLEARARACVAAGVAESAIVLDPGIGFGKRLRDNLALIGAIPRLRALGFPVLMGVSRKSFLGAITGASVEDREIETAAAVALCTALGADGARVHDVAAQGRAQKVAAALRPFLPGGFLPAEEGGVSSRR